MRGAGEAGCTLLSGIRGLQAAPVGGFMASENQVSSLFGSGPSFEAALYIEKAKALANTPHVPTTRVYISGTAGAVWGKYKFFWSVKWETSFLHGETAPGNRYFSVGNCYPNLVLKKKSPHLKSPATGSAFYSLGFHSMLLPAGVPVAAGIGFRNRMQ